MVNSNISDEDLDKIIGLSKLNFTKDEKSEIKKDLSDVIGYFEIISKADTKAVKNIVSNYSETREDKIVESFKTEEIIKNAKNKNENSFVVPRVVE